MKFSIYQESRQGGRSNNEDRLAYSYSREAILMVVADGMGGHDNGEIASQIAVQVLMDGFQREAKPAIEDPYHFLQKYLNHAHNSILKYATKHYLAECPRTTIVACIIQHNIAYWAHAGDSRLYLFRNGKPLSQTRDHSRIRLMLDAGIVSPAAAQNHPDRNKVYSCLGGSQNPEIEFSRKTPLAAGDILLLCTDGFWAGLPPEMLAADLEKKELAQAIPPLMAQAEKINGPGSDNLSVIALRWAENYVEAAGSTIFSQTMGLDDMATNMQGVDGVRSLSSNHFSDDDIERAIEEIRLAINKTTPRK